MEKETLAPKDSTLDQSSMNDTDTIATKVEDSPARLSSGDELTPPPSEKAPPASQEEEWEYITGFRLAAVMITITMTCFLMLLDTSIVATAIPSITSDFHSLNDVGCAGLTPITGKIYSRFGSKSTFMCFVALFELGSLICGVAQSSKMLIVGRAVAGMGGSGLINGALTIIAACVPLEKRAVHMGILMAFAQLGVLFGPLIGGAFTQYTTWRWCFYINLPAGAVVLFILTFVRIPDRNKNRAATTIQETIKGLDLPGFALFAPGAIMLLLALQWGGTTYAWSSATIIGLFCGSAGMVAIFMGWEYTQGDRAMIPWAMIKQRIVWSSCASVAFFFGGQLINSYYLAIYFQSVRGVSPTLSGVSMLPGILSQMLFAPISGYLVGRLGYYLPWAVGGSALASIGYGLISLYGVATPTGTWIGYQIIGGVGRGMSLQMPLLAIQSTLKPEQIPVGMAICTFFQTLGGALFISFAQTGFSTGLSQALGTFAPQVSVQVVEVAGATGFRSVIPAEYIPGVIDSYAQSVSHVFYIAAASAAAGFVANWGMGWKSVKKPKVVEPAA
ncbi:hypothetical protein G7Y89_g1264 [Cudoniella acicularis]|uniref:Major facilitator superfamily (MFS) profile domain-containing protein n=1 Tax=Cudoniella acicularis TaxID=354080 RepID=A0A8H4RX98_9HELO|nr:hypothetical protein G7Y89_g1264 [Cudoniella acicularis]